jgi:peptidyl-tRNA hydrolase, PTH1 family
VAFRSSKGAAERSGTPADWLIVGLGNPGDEYLGSRHNLGAEVVTLVAERFGGRLKMGRERALSCEVRDGMSRLALAYPQTFMNLSGESVRLLTKRHGITDPARIVVIHDELDLPTGRIKLKLGGGVAGHNGLKSIQSHLHTPDFARLRVGIGRPPGQQQVSDYVLRRPGKAERALLDVAVQRSVEAIGLIVSEGVERAMNVVNTAPD